MASHLWCMDDNINRRQSKETHGVCNEWVQELATFKEAWRANESRLASEKRALEEARDALEAKKRSFGEVQAAAVRELEGREALIAEREVRKQRLRLVHPSEVNGI